MTPVRASSTSPAWSNQPPEGGDLGGLFLLKDEEDRSRVRTLGAEALAAAQEALCFEGNDRGGAVDAVGADSYPPAEPAEQYGEHDSDAR
jgi:hypothetical protein